jgi:uncharacterized repeat protein (TIGR01451 family)
MMKHRSVYLLVAIGIAFLAVLALGLGLGDANAGAPVRSVAAPAGLSPSLSISKSGPAVAPANAPITYTLTITNSGSISATGLIISDVLPVGATYMSGGVFSGGVVTWSVTSLDPGNTTTVQFAVSATTTITNDDYRVEASGGYSATGSVSVVTVIASQGLALSKSAPAVARQGAPITYTLVVTNLGNVPASGVRISDTLPVGASYVSGGSLVGNVVTWPPFNLAAGASAQVTFVVTAGDNIVNTTYRATADGGLLVVGSAGVPTAIPLLYLPAVYNNYLVGEPNDTCDTAYLIGVNTSYPFLPDDDNDWYHFNAGASSSLVIELTNFTPIAGQVAVYRGATCASRVFLGNNGNFAASKSVNLGAQPAGHYYVYVSNDGPESTTTPYQLRVSLTP